MGLLRKIIPRELRQVFKPIIDTVTDTLKKPFESAGKALAKGAEQTVSPQVQTILSTAEDIKDDSVTAITELTKELRAWRELVTSFTQVLESLEPLIYLLITLLAIWLAYKLCSVCARRGDIQEGTPTHGRVSYGAFFAGATAATVIIGGVALMLADEEDSIIIGNKF